MYICIFSGRYFLPIVYFNCKDVYLGLNLGVVKHVDHFSLAAARYESNLSHSRGQHYFFLGITEAADEEGTSRLSKPPTEILYASGLRESDTALHAFPARVPVTRDKNEVLIYLFVSRVTANNAACTGGQHLEHISVTKCLCAAAGGFQSVRVTHQ